MNPTLKLVILEVIKDVIGKDYIGTTFDGFVKAVPVDNARKVVHLDFDMISGVNSQNWRYIASKNQVLWNQEPIPEDKIKVDDFLVNRGIKDPLHKNMYNYNMFKEGISYQPDTHEFTFNWEKDEETDIINLVKTRKKISTKAGVEYYVSYVALPKDNKYTTEYKTAMNLFRNRLKTLTLSETDIDRMIDGAIDGFIGAYGNRLDNIGLIVTPKSTSVLNKRMSAKLHGLMPTARLVDDLFTKSMIDDIKINTEKIKGTPEQQEETLKRAIKMLDNFKKKNVEFTLKKIHPKYRNLFGGFMKLSVDLDSELLEIIKSKDVLVVDDFLTKGFTMKEINRILQSYKLEGSVVNFILVLQG